MILSLERFRRSRQIKNDRLPMTNLRWPAALVAVFLSDSRLFASIRGWNHSVAELLHLLHRPRPILFEQQRQRPVGQQPATRLALGTIIRFVARIPNPLHLRPANGARLAELAMHR